MFHLHPYSLSGFCDFRTLWVLCHTSRSIRVQFLRFAIAKSSLILEDLFTWHLLDTYAPFIDSLTIWSTCLHFERCRLPKLRNVRYYAQEIAFEYLENLRSFAWYPKFFPALPLNFQWPDTLASLTLGYNIKSLSSYPRNLLTLDLQCPYYDLREVPSSVTFLTSTRMAGPFWLPQCTNLVKLVANRWNEPFLDNEHVFPQTLTYLRLNKFNGLVNFRDLPPGLKILKLGSMTQVIPIPKSVIRLSIGVELDVILPMLSPSHQSSLNLVNFHSMGTKSGLGKTYWKYKREHVSREN